MFSQILDFYLPLVLMEPVPALVSKGRGEGQYVRNLHDTITGNSSELNCLRLTEHRVSLSRFFRFCTRPCSGIGSWAFEFWLLSMVLNFQPWLSDVIGE